jgi:hypothetical protein
MARRAVSNAPSGEWVVPPSEGPDDSHPARETPRPVRKSRGAVLLTLVVAEAIVIVALLLLTGVIPGFHLPSPGSSSPPLVGISERAAAALANPYANGTAGGPWSLNLVMGEDPTYTTQASVFVGCPLTGSAHSNLTVPGFNGTYADGLAVAWILEYYSAVGTGSEIALLVENGTVTNLGRWGPPCVGSAIPDIPSGIIDSTTAAQALVASSFLGGYRADHLTSNASYLLRTVEIPRTSTETYWDIGFSGCAGWNDTELEYAVNASSGQVTNTYADSSVSFTCDAPRPLTNFLRAGTPVASVGNSSSGPLCRSGDACYSVPVSFEAGGAGVSGGIRANDLTARVEYAANNTTYTVGAALGEGISWAENNGTVEAAGGAPSASGQPLTVSTWTTGASTVLSGQLVLWVDLGTVTSHADQGLELIVGGLGLYYGSVTVDLP